MFTLDLSTLSDNVLILSINISISDWKFSFSFWALLIWSCSIDCFSCCFSISVSAFSLSVSACNTCRWKPHFSSNYIMETKNLAVGLIYNIHKRQGWVIMSLYFFFAFKKLSYAKHEKYSFLCLCSFLWLQSTGFFENCCIRLTIQHVIRIDTCCYIQGRIWLAQTKPQFLPANAMQCILVHFWCLILNKNGL